MICAFINKIKKNIKDLKEIVLCIEASLDLILWDIQNRISLYEYHKKNGVLLEEEIEKEEHFFDIKTNIDKLGSPIEILNYYLEMLNSIYTEYLEAKNKYHIGFEGYKCICLFLFYPIIFRNLKTRIDSLHTISTENLTAHSEHVSVSHILLANDVLGAVNL